MRSRTVGTIIIAAAILPVITAGQFRILAQQRAPQPVAASPQRGVQPAAAAPQRGPQPSVRLARIAGHPNLNGVWQALNSANWNLEAHGVTGLSQFWQLGAIASIPAGKSMLKGGGTIPYKPEALKQRDDNRAKWPASDN